MLFNSYIFLFAFLPAVLLVTYVLLKSAGARTAVWGLIVASMVFYGYWNPRYLALLLGSIVCNYGIGLFLRRSAAYRRTAFAVGIVLNLVGIGYFKYAGFLVDNLNNLVGSELRLGTIVLPLAISFYTFQQVSYLVDAYRRRIEEHGFASYCLFISFFPQLIAGPIVRHGETVPQFENPRDFRITVGTIMAGLDIFALGLFKKVVLADTFGLYAGPVFDAAEAGTPLTMVEAWGGALSYTFQLYFDFSGYSDMAVGLAAMFGIRLPINFESPYKATSIIDFWHRWHITLSRFLRDYVYFALGGNRQGELRRYTNVMATMLIGGLWHGASWIFVFWGGLHGLYLLVNHAWVKYKPPTLAIPPTLGRLLTFVLVLIGWVFFRSETVSGSFAILRSMVAWETIGHPLRETVRYQGALEFGWLLAGLAIVWALPNVHQVVSRAHRWLAGTRSRVPLLATGATLAVVALINIAFIYYHSAIPEYAPEFLYFQF